jgi:hypothetical protein
VAPTPQHSIAPHHNIHKTALAWMTCTFSYLVTTGNMQNKNHNTTRRTCQHPSVADALVKQDAPHPAVNRRQSMLQPHQSIAPHRTTAFTTGTCTFSMLSFETWHGRK